MGCSASTPTRDSNGDTTDEYDTMTVTAANQSVAARHRIDGVVKQASVREAPHALLLPPSAGGAPRDTQTVRTPLTPSATPSLATPTSRRRRQKMNGSAFRSVATCNGPSLTTTTTTTTTTTSNLTTNSGEHPHDLVYGGMAPVALLGTGLRSTTVTFDDDDSVGDADFLLCTAAGASDEHGAVDSQPRLVAEDAFGE
jgi:hypothetical protein